MKKVLKVKKAMMIAVIASLSGMVCGQVGIHNNSPQATLDVTAKTTDGSKPEGIIAPRLTGDQIKAADAQYTVAQTGAIVYVTAAVSVASPKTANITAAGYYYFDGSLWQKSGGAGMEPWYNAATNTEATSNTQNIYQMGKVGIGNASPDASAQLDVTSTTGGFLAPRVTSAQRDAISNPATGLIIYNTDINCLQINFGTPAAPLWQCSGGDPSSNGNSHVSSYNCSGGDTGTLSTGVSANGVTHTIIATVATPGTYTITATSNGVTYYGSGAFSSAGTQQIVLTAIGIPASAGVFTYTLNTNPSCSFTVSVNDGTSGGTSNVSNWDCSTASSGSLITGQPVSGVTQTVTATVATVGTYNLSATANGVTFSGNGTFSSSGAQTVVLTAAGTPAMDGTYGYTLNVSNPCTFVRSSVSTPLVSGLGCNSAAVTGSVVSGSGSSGVYVTVPYTGGNGMAYNSQLIGSTGVTGLTASLASGTLSNNGSGGNLIFSISGIANAPGVASFPLTFGGQSCTFSVNVNTPSAVATLNCAGSTSSGTLTAGIAASGVTQTIPYTGGNGGVYNDISIASGGVTGLTATALAGSVANGAGSLVISIVGTPSNSGTATFTVNFGGQTCSFTRTVQTAGATVTGITCGSAVAFPNSLLSGAAYNGTLSVPYIGGNGGTYSAGTGIASTGVTGLTATLQAGTLASGAGNLIYTVTGTPSGAGTASVAITFGGQSCTVNLTVTSLAGIVPPNLTLTQNQKYFVASVYDTDYLPYTAPTAAASTATLAADGIPDNPTIDVQGSITTTGVTVRIPATATGSGTLPAYSTTVTVPASLTEDGNSRILTLSWASQAYTASTTYITATIMAVGGTLNAKKLDINAGIGNDYLGVLLAQFSYPYNNAGTATAYQVRDIPGIPDKMFGKADNSGTLEHQFLYLPVQGEDGNIWLNNNLGANYTNLNSGRFNITQQATAYNDSQAYGSMFQWGRSPDGHELINWPSGVPVYSTTTTLSDSPTNTLFIINPNDPSDWRVNQNSTLWAAESSVNNPCPSGFRLPAVEEVKALIKAAGITNYTNAASSALKFSILGGRFNSTGAIAYTAVQGLYWTNTVAASGAKQYSSYYQFTSSTAGGYASYPRGPGFAVRCIKD